MTAWGPSRGVGQNGHRVPRPIRHGARAGPVLHRGALIDEVELQAALLTAVATGGKDFRLKHIQRQHRNRRRRLVAALRQRGLTYPFPWQDLSQWYGYWTGNNLGTYAQRRAAIRELVAPTIEALEQQRSGLRVSDPGSGPVTWTDLDERLSELSAELDGAISRDDLQDVGRRAREILIDCAELLADPSLVPTDQDPPKAEDAMRWLGHCSKIVPETASCAASSSVAAPARPCHRTGG